MISPEPISKERSRYPFFYRAVHFDSPTRIKQYSTIEVYEIGTWKFEVRKAKEAIFKERPYFVVYTRRSQYYCLTIRDHSLTYAKLLHAVEFCAVYMPKFYENYPNEILKYRERL